MIIEVSEGIKGLDLRKEDPVMFLPSGQNDGSGEIQGCRRGESWDPSTEVGWESGEFGHGSVPSAPCSSSEMLYPATDLKNNQT